MNPARPALVFACVLALHAPHRAADHPTAPRVRSAHAQEAAAARPPEQERSLAELLRAVEGEGREDAESWFRLGVAQDDAGDLGGALKSFRQALKLRPGFDMARAGAAYVLHKQGKTAEAEKEAEKVSIRAGTRESRVLALNVLVVIRTARQEQQAERELAKAERELAKKPDDADANLRKAVALLNTPYPGRRTTPPFRTYIEPRPAPGTGPGIAPPAPDENTRRAAREAARKRYEAVAAAFDKYLRLKPDARDRDFVSAQLEALRFYMREGAGAAATGEPVFAIRDVNSRAVILAKPDPGFTEEARQNGVNGVVRLRAVLAADATVKHILVVKGLPHGLSERAVEAARRIKFKPATFDGRPVSQYVTLEYNFNVY